ncbi:MAG: DMT family transporter [Pseudomonadota bacterium]
MIQALVIMLIAMSCIPAGDAASKILTSQLDVAPVYVVWTRFALGAALLLPFTWRAGLGAWRDWRIWARSAIIAAGISCITQAFRLAPLADVFGAFFIAPIVSFVLSVTVLKERSSAVQAALVALGFIGVLMIARPGFAASPGLGWAVLAGVFYGLFLTVSRYLSGQVALGALILSQMLGPALLTTPFALGAIPELTPRIAWLTCASAFFSMAGNVLLLFAYRMQEASKLAPFVYFQLISAAVLGWIIFGDFPDALTIAGMALIIGAGVMVTALQSRRPRASSSQPR